MVAGGEWRRLLYGEKGFNVCRKGLLVEAAAWARRGRRPDLLRFAGRLTYENRCRACCFLIS